MTLPGSEVHEKDAKVSGWGMSEWGANYDKIYPCKLKEATLKVKCLRFKSFNRAQVEKPVSERCPATSETKLCVHHQNVHPPAATCWGDSGGPLTIDEGGFEFLNVVFII